MTKQKTPKRVLDRESPRRVRQATRAQARTLKALTIRQGERAFQILVEEVSK